MDKTLKASLLAYAGISAVSFTYLVLPELSSFGVPVFALLQCVMVTVILARQPLANKRALLWFLPILILAGNYFWSANRMWSVPNVFVITLLAAVMALRLSGNLSLHETLFAFVPKILRVLYKPFRSMKLPLRWTLGGNKKWMKTALHLLGALAVALPVLVLIVLLLMSADQVFSGVLADWFRSFGDIIRPSVLFKCLLGLLVGGYLFGFVLRIITAQSAQEEEPQVRESKGDMLYYSVLLGGVLAVYALFVFVQFRYLFAFSELPYGLEYHQYARRGFFELLLLTGINILILLYGVHRFGTRTDTGAVALRIAQLLLCAATMVLLASSAFRMWLYWADDGLTRLRALVFGFLFFEAIGLILTAVYVFRPRFNIVLGYFGIALCYYLVLNTVNLDALVAKSQVERYLRGQKAGIHYVSTLSPDAAEQLARLTRTGDAAPETVQPIYRYFERHGTYYSQFVPRWQRYNLSVDRMNHLRLTLPPLN